MNTVMLLAVMAVMAGVLIVLVRGVIQMFRGGDPRRSNQLMQQRVMLQALALVLMALMMIFWRS